MPLFYCIATCVPWCLQHYITLFLIRSLQEEKKTVKKTPLNLQYICLTLHIDSVHTIFSFILLFC